MFARKVNCGNVYERCPSFFKESIKIKMNYVNLKLASLIYFMWRDDK